MAAVMTNETSKCSIAKVERQLWLYVPFVLPFAGFTSYVGNTKRYLEYSKCRTCVDEHVL